MRSPPGAGITIHLITQSASGFFNGKESVLFGPEIILLVLQSCLTSEYFPPSLDFPFPLVYLILYRLSADTDSLCCLLHPRLGSALQSIRFSHLISFMASSALVSDYNISSPVDIYLHCCDSQTANVP